MHVWCELLCLQEKQQITIFLLALSVAGQVSEIYLIRHMMVTTKARKTTSSIADSRIISTTGESVASDQRSVSIKPTIFSL